MYPSSSGMLTIAVSQNGPPFGKMVESAIQWKPMGPPMAHSMGGFSIANCQKTRGNDVSFHDLSLFDKNI
jgi:hypothetical protein